MERKLTSTRLKRTLAKVGRLLSLAATCVALMACTARNAVPDSYVYLRDVEPSPRQLEQPAPTTQLRVPERARDTALNFARAQLGSMKVEKKRQFYPNDCSGLVRSVFAPLGVDLMSEAKSGDNATTAIYRFAQKYGRIYTGGRPVAGDLVFFKETYDVNRDGKENDGLTHVAVVDDVEDNGTVSVIHHVKGGVKRYKMNLAQPHLNRSEEGEILNDWLRPSTKLGKAQLTGELFAAYATLLPIEPKLSAQR